MASYDVVNYSLRLKKNVERKLLADLLLAISKKIRLEQYRYVGMGSLWFSDFMLFHRALGIRQMLSVEINPIGHSRAKINRPFGFVRLEQGDITAVLKRTLALKRRPSVLAWLDHDSDLAHGIVSELLDIAALARDGDILIVTANASPQQLGAPSTRGNEETQQAYQERILEEKKVRFTTLTNGLVPVRGTKDLQKAQFSKLVGSSLIEAINSGCNAAGQGTAFDCLFNLQYSDGAPMVTIGGIVQRARRRVNPKSIQRAFPFAQGKKQISIDVPILTYREKARLDRAIGRKPGELPSTAKVGFELAPGQAQQYIDYYSYYPVFGEISY